MKKMILLSSMLVLSAVFALAQYGSQDNSNQNNTGSQSSMGSKMTVVGCLSGSDGNYSLTDKSGTMYNLTGDTAQLQAHVGHTISVTGTNTPSTSSSGQSGAMSSPSDTHQTLMVTSFKHVSPNCASASQ
jgi:hypothetical protein